MIPVKARLSSLLSIQNLSYSAPIQLELLLDLPLNQDNLVQLRRFLKELFLLRFAHNLTFILADNFPIKDLFNIFSLIAPSTILERLAFTPLHPSRLEITEPSLIQKLSELCTERLVWDLTTFTAEECLQLASWSRYIVTLRNKMLDIKPETFVISGATLEKTCNELKFNRAYKELSLLLDTLRKSSCSKNDPRFISFQALREGKICSTNESKKIKAQDKIAECISHDALSILPATAITTLPSSALVMSAPPPTADPEPQLSEDFDNFLSAVWQKFIEDEQKKEQEQAKKQDNFPASSSTTSSTPSTSLKIMLRISPANKPSQIILLQQDPKELFACLNTQDEQLINQLFLNLKSMPISYLIDYFKQDHLIKYFTDNWFVQGNLIAHSSHKWAHNIVIAGYASGAFTCNVDDECCTAQLSRRKSEFTSITLLDALRTGSIQGSNASVLSFYIKSLEEAATRSVDNNVKQQLSEISSKAISKVRKDIEGEFKPPASKKLKKEAPLVSQELTGRLSTS